MGTPLGMGPLPGHTTAGHVQPRQNCRLRSAGRGLWLAQGGGAALGSTAAQMCCSPQVTQVFHPAHERGSAGTVGSAGHIGRQAQQLASQGQGLCTELGMP